MNDKDNREKFAGQTTNYEVFDGLKKHPVIGTAATVLAGPIGLGMLELNEAGNAKVARSKAEDAKSAAAILVNAQREAEGLPVDSAPTSKSGSGRGTRGA